MSSLLKFWMFREWPAVGQGVERRRGHGWWWAWRRRSEGGRRRQMMWKGRQLRVLLDRDSDYGIDDFAKCLTCSKLPSVPQVSWECPFHFPEVLFCESSLSNGAQNDGLGLWVEILDRFSQTNQSHSVFGAKHLLFVRIQNILEKWKTLAARKIC